MTDKSTPELCADIKMLASCYATAFTQPRCSHDNVVMLSKVADGMQAIAIELNKRASHMMFHYNDRDN